MSDATWATASTDESRGSSAIVIVPVNSVKRPRTLLTIRWRAEKATVEAVAQVASITTNDEQRDGHLKNSDFFDAEAFPTLTFKSTSIRPDGDDFVLVGDLTIKDVTLPVEFELEYEGASADPWGGSRIGFSAEAEVNRKDFGMEWNMALETGGFVIGDKVKITLDVEAVKA